MGISQEEYRAGMRKWASEMGLWHAQMEIIRLDREKVLDMLWLDPANLQACDEKADLDRQHEEAFNEYQAARANYQECRRCYMEAVTGHTMTVDWDMPHLDW